ncbi:hypothetical protein, partial [Parapedobacter soli]|uniref:hypothetical protein n=1 Tax=Parapedobacter soli TaxID=416955 RepID=UPI0021C71F2E
LAVKIPASVKPQTVRAHAKNPTAQMAHLVFADTRTNASKNQKSHFFANARTDRATIIQTPFILKNEIK